MLGFFTAIGAVYLIGFCVGAIIEIIAQLLPRPMPVSAPRSAVAGVILHEPCGSYYSSRAGQLPGPTAGLLR